MISSSLGLVSILVTQWDDNKTLLTNSCQLSTIILKTKQNKTKQNESS